MSATTQTWATTTFTFAETFQETSTRATTSTSTYYYPSETPYQYIEETVEISVLIEIPMTCENVLDLLSRTRNTTWDYRNRVEGDISSNPDIAGIGVCAKDLSSNLKRLTRL